jgi:hypothetical protein
MTFWSPKVEPRATFLKHLDVCLCDHVDLQLNSLYTRSCYWVRDEQSRTRTRKEDKDGDQHIESKSEPLMGVRKVRPSSFL